MEVVPTNDKSPGHLGGDDDALEDTSTDRHIGCERALLIHIGPHLGTLRSLEAQTHGLGPSETLVVVVL